MTNLPSNWVTRRLADVAEVIMGQSPPGSTYNKSGDGAPFFQGKAEFGAKHPTVRQWTTAGTKFAKAGDVLMSVRAPVGPTNIADVDCAIGRGLAAIRAGNELDQKYLIWYLKHVEASIQSRGKGTTFDSISGNDLRDTIINLPPLEEQKRIVEVLDENLSRLDKALAALESADMQSLVFRRSILHELLAARVSDYEPGTKRINAPKKWSVSTMGQIGKYLNGRAFKEADWKTTGRPIIRIQNLTGSGKSFNYFQGDAEPRYLVKDGDLLFSWAATLGTYIWHGPEAVLNQHIFKVESNINPKFHRYLLEHSIQEMQTKTHGSGMVHITKSEFDKIEVAVPPLEEQRRIVEVLDQQLSQLDSARASIASQKASLETLRRSLLSKAFNGNLGSD